MMFHQQAFRQLCHLSSRRGVQLGHYLTDAELGVCAAVTALSRPGGNGGGGLAGFALILSGLILYRAEKNTFPAPAYRLS